MVTTSSLLKITVAVLILFIAAVLAKPTLVGYSTYQQMQRSNYSLEEYAENVRDLQNSLTLASTNLSVQKEFMTELQKQNHELSKKVTDCVLDKNSQILRYNLSFNSCQEKIHTLQQESESEREECTSDLAQQREEAAQAQQECSSELQQIRDLLTSAQDTFNITLADAARRICCKEKVDNPRINYFSLLNNKIVCTDEGSQELHCFS